MAKITLEEFYRGDEYNVMGETFKDLWTNGIGDEDLQTALELALVKQSVLATIKMLKNGDFISEIQPEMKALFLSEVEKRKS